MVHGETFWRDLERTYVGKILTRPELLLTINIEISSTKQSESSIYNVRVMYTVLKPLENASISHPSGSKSTFAIHESKSFFKRFLMNNSARAAAAVTLVDLLHAKVPAKTKNVRKCYTDPKMRHILWKRVYSSYVLCDRGFRVFRFCRLVDHEL